MNIMSTIVFRFTSAKRNTLEFSNSLIDNMKECRYLVKSLSDHEDAEMFLFPVSKRDVSIMYKPRCIMY